MRIPAPRLAFRATRRRRNCWFPVDAAARLVPLSIQWPLLVTFTVISKKLMAPISAALVDHHTESPQPSTIGVPPISLRLRCHIIGTGKLR